MSVKFMFSLQMFALLTNFQYVKFGLLDPPNCTVLENSNYLSYKIIKKKKNAIMQSQNCVYYLGMFSRSTNSNKKYLYIKTIIDYRKNQFYRVTKQTLLKKNYI